MGDLFKGAPYGQHLENAGSLYNWFLDEDVGGQVEPIWFPFMAKILNGLHIQQEA